MADDKSQIGYNSGKVLMAQGSHALHEHVASKVEAALGRALPQMEIRFNNLSLAADIVVASADPNTKTELPSITNALKKSFGGVLAKRNVVRKEILKNVSGAFKPGTVTLLLGQPGSGKSSLMKILSGRFPLEKNITVDGEITYNGQVQQELKKVLPQFAASVNVSTARIAIEFAAYVNQRDKHSPTLTVKETLEYAHTFTGGELTRRGEELLSNGSSEENMAALQATRAMFAHYPEVIIEQLGLQKCQDTVVGDAMLRGVSGGERKRVTTGEMEFGMKYVTLMDEISTGLDSAATYDIISTQRSIAKKLRKTVVIALLQPSPEVFALFDDVMILNTGELMYHGPREQVVDYFESLGFACPPERDIADYLLDLGTKEQKKYEVSPPPHAHPKHPRYPSEFAEVFRRSDIHANMLHALMGPHNPELLANVGLHMDLTPEFHQSFWASTWTLIKRESLVQSRNTPFLVGRAIMVALMGTLYATTFYDFNPTNIQVVMGLCFTAVLFLALGQIALIPTFMASRDIFYKHRGANFFRTSSYVLANSLSLLPVVSIEAVVFGTLVYWMCGFTSSASCFSVFLVLLLLTNITYGAWFFFLSSALPNINVTIPLAMLSNLLSILFTGFVVLKSQVPDYFIWIYWLSPMSWSVRGIAINQYRSSELDVCVYDGVDYCAQFDGKTMGEYYLGLFDVATEKKWVAYGVVYLVALYFLFMCFSCFALEYRRHESPENVGFSKPEDEDEGNRYTLATTPKLSSDLSLPRTSVHVVDVHTTREKNFIPVTLAFKDLWYTVPLPSNPKESIDLLKGITGYALPGTITALMGSSGAGKTTLMDVIAGRKTGGEIQGKILLNGYEATDLAIRRSTGYCEQVDIHSESATIREALTFSAFLRQDSTVPQSKKFDSVNEALDLLGMHNIADQIIRGRSVEQMKRLTIGVEMAAQPSVLFLDEPTSGLDARSAKLIMEGVRKVANSGRTVVCTIHQPSSEVFFLFDQLLLLKRGGETVFFGELGEGCHTLVDYFEAIPGVTPLPVGYNPATWMLECIGAGVSNDAANDTDFVKCFNESELKHSLDAEVAKPGVGHIAPGSSELLFSNKRASTSYTQMTFLVTRFFGMYWRTPAYTLTRIVLALVLALLFGLLFVDADYDSYQGVNSGIGMINLSFVFNGFISLNSAIPVSAQDRASFYRERASQTYNAFWYFVGWTLAEVPYALLSGLIFTVVFFPMVGFTGFTAGVIYWLNTSLLMLYHSYFGQLLAFAFPSEEVATIMAIMTSSIFLLFMGFSPPTSMIPSGYKWLYRITPHTYTFSIFVSLIFADCPSDARFDASLGEFVDMGSELGCQSLRNAPITLGHVTVKQFTEDVFGMKHDEIGQNFGILIGIVVFYRILALLALRFLNHQKKTIARKSQSVLGRRSRPCEVCCFYDWRIIPQIRPHAYCQAPLQDGGLARNIVEMFIAMYGKVASPNDEVMNGHSLETAAGLGGTTETPHWLHYAWQVQGNAPSCQQDNGMAAAPATLTLLQIFPVHEQGASYARFTFDDQQLITVGECAIKVWDVSVAAPVSRASSADHEAELLSEKLPIEAERTAWEAEIPFELTLQRSMELFMFDETLSSMIGNHEWQYFLTPRPANQERELESARSSPHEHSSVVGLATSIPSVRADDDPASGTTARNQFQLSAEKTEQLERYHKQLAEFGFELLLNPAIPFPRLLDSNESQSGDDNNAEECPSSATATTTKELIWNPLRPDADGKLLRTFTKTNENGFFLAHTSTITCCAVVKQVDTVVTVSLDKCIKFWSLAEGKVLETIRAAPITCCALTLSSQEATATRKDLVLATGGKGNLVKVRRQCENEPSTECIYSFSGHYDAITCCIFDPSGVFLTSAGDGTKVIAWRVAPSSPDQPKQPALVSVDRFAITISWDESLAHGSQLLYYVIRTKQVTSLVEGGYGVVDISDTEVPAEYTTKTVDKLQPGIQHTFQLAVANAIGASPFSEATLPIETLAFVPSQIEKPVQCSDREAVLIRLSWKQPSANESIPTAFLEPVVSLASTDAVVVAKKKTTLAKVKEKTTRRKEASITVSKKTKMKATGSGSNVKAVEPKSQQKLPPASVFYSFVVEGLWPGEIYQFVVATENRCGLGAFSRVTDYVKMDCTATDPPQQPAIINIQKRQVDIVWEKPRCNGSEILRYTLERIQHDQVGSVVLPGTTNDCNSDTASSYEPTDAAVPGPALPVSNSIVLLTRSISGTSYTLQGLEPGQPLRVWLSASSPIDKKTCTSKLSRGSEVATTLCDVPDAPARPALMQPSAHTLLLAFTPPKCNGLEIQSYDVTLYFEEAQFGIANRQVFREFKLWVSDCEAISNAGFTSAFTIKKLRGSTYYNAELRAINELGASAMSECSTLVSTKPPTVPAQMLEPPIIRDIEPGRARITWGIPEHDGGAPADDLDENVCKALFDQEVTIYHNQELLVTFLKPKTTYRFRVASSNAAGKAPFSERSVAVHMPSLVEFTIAHYFADRPELEHVKARYIQGNLEMPQVLFHTKWLHAKLESFTPSLFCKGAMEGLLDERLLSGAAPVGVSAHLAPGNIRSLILEKELHDINEYRIRTLEALLRDKESAANGYKQKFTKLQEDFKYNLKVSRILIVLPLRYGNLLLLCVCFFYALELLGGRDEELALYDTNFANIKSVLRDREVEISELKAQVADLHVDLKQEQTRCQDQEIYFQQKLKDARAQMEGARWQFDDELRRQKDEMEQTKRKTDRRMREQEENLEAQRREISVTFDESKNRDLELKLKATQRDNDANKDRSEETKIKMENMQQLLQENEKELKAVEWQLSDMRSAKDAKINELEDEIAKLQDVKQALLDEYEGKMAELLQSLHSVEKAFVQQKKQYEEELQHRMRRKDEEFQTQTLRLEEKTASLTTKLREQEERYEQVQAELKQTKWDGDDKLLEKDHEAERLKSEMQDIEDQKQAMATDFKQQLWNSGRENVTLQEKLKDLQLQIQVHKEKEKVHCQELLDSMEKQEDLKREVVTLNLRWENKWQDQEQETKGRSELRIRELQQMKERLLAEKQATEERLVHAENELQRFRSEMYLLKSNDRIAESFDSQYNGAKKSSMQDERSNLDGVSPLERSDFHSSVAPMSVAASPLSQKRCILLEAKLLQLEALQKPENDTNLITAISEVSAQLAFCKAELQDANRTIEVKNGKIAELEASIAQLSQEKSPTGLPSDRVIVDAQVPDLKQKLATADVDIQRLVKERSQLMGLSNHLYLYKVRYI
ncbi:Atp-binding protein, partial [Globisporangium splendens]